MLGLLFLCWVWVPRALPGAPVAVAEGGQVLPHLPSPVLQVMDISPLNNSQQPALLEGLPTALQGKHHVQLVNLMAVCVCVDKNIPHQRTRLGLEFCSSSFCSPLPRCDSKARCQLVILGCGGAISVWGGQ